MLRWIFALILIACGPPPLEGEDGREPPETGPTYAYSELPFATEVVDFQAGDGAGFGASRLPDIVLGPPEGGGEFRGGHDVLSLGRGGSITLGFRPRDCIDGPGPDFVVFENAFRVRGGSGQTFQELGEVSVSEDGESWSTFDCDPGPIGEPQPGCAGWSPVLISGLAASTPLDPDRSGGDAFDLEDLGLERIRYLRIRDVSAVGEAPTAGFDLDSVGLVHFR